MDKTAQEMQPYKINERLAVAEELLKNEKVKLPDDVLANALEGLRKIKEKLEKRLPVYENDFDFVKELEEAIKTGLHYQYNEAIKSLRGGNLYNSKNPIEGDKKAPTLEEVTNAIKTKFTPEQREVIAQMKKPVLIVKPITTWKRFEKNLNSITEIHENTREREWSYNDIRASVTDKITGWEVGFAEGEEKLEDKRGNLKKLIDEWENEPIAKKGAKLLTNNEYMLLMARSAKKGEPIDKGCSSILKVEGKDKVADGDRRVSCGGWMVNTIGGKHIDKPLFHGYAVDPTITYGKIVFRYGVMIKI